MAALPRPQGHRHIVDVVLHDAQIRLRSENGPGNMAAPRYMAMNLIRNAGREHSLKARRRAAAQDTTASKPSPQEPHNDHQAGPPGNSAATGRVRAGTHLAPLRRSILAPPAAAP